MEEARTTRRAPLLVALVGVLLLAAVWATMALAGSGSTPAAKPAQAPAAPAQSSDDQRGYAGKSGGDHDCPFEEGTSNDL